MYDICKARRQADEMRCVPCGLLWDATDPEPPTCGQGLKQQKELPIPTQRAATWCKICGVGNDAFKLMHAAGCPNYKVRQ